MGCYFSYKAKGEVGTGAQVGRKDQVGAKIVGAQWILQGWKEWQVLK